jgi:hypothetical protein
MRCGRDGGSGTKTDSTENGSSTAERSEKILIDREKFDTYFRCNLNFHLAAAADLRARFADAPFLSYIACL